MRSLGILFFVFSIILLFSPTNTQPAYDSADETTLYKTTTDFALSDNSMVILYVFESGRNTTNQTTFNVTWARREVFDNFYDRSGNSSENGTLPNNTTSHNNTISSNNTLPIPNHRAIYFPLVDDFSQLSVPLSGQYFYDVPSVSLWLNVSGIVSDTRYYKAPGRLGVYNGALTAVINLVGGKITTVSWDDDDCSDCSEDVCIQQGLSENSAQNCGIPYDSVGYCQLSQYCNILIYLAWRGTDVNNNYCTSYSSVPSQLSQWSWFPIYEAAAGITQNKIFTADPFAGLNANGNPGGNAPPGGN